MRSRITSFESHGGSDGGSDEGSDPSSTISDELRYESV